MKAHPIANSFKVSAILAFLGGFLDVYTYITREEVFAFAHTGNIIFLCINLIEGNFKQASLYIFPILFFISGIFFVETMRVFFRHKRFHWQQSLLLMEAGGLTFAGFLPDSYSYIATGIVSFICGLQVQGFRHMRDLPVATTMCTGNMRTASEKIFDYIITKKPESKRQGLYIFGLVGTFALGAMSGTIFTKLLDKFAILICAIGFIYLSSLFFEKKDITT
ncbi:MAG: YoaK family protein [Brevinema sp.]